MRLLLVEDDPVDVAAARHSLRDFGFEIVAVGCLAEALERLEHDSFDLILLDLALPDSCGTATFERTQRTAGDQPIVVMTTHGDPERGSRFVEMGAIDYVVKGELIGSPLARALRYATKRHAIEKELREAKTAALAAARAKSEFLASMSHEIRTPLNSILGMADLLGETGLNEEQQQYVNVFKSAGETLLEIINGILDLSKAESGKLEMDHRPFDLVALLDSTLDILAFSAHQKGLVVASDVRPGASSRLVGDPLRLRQILINLIGNAVKFTPAGEVVVRVETDPAESEPGGLLFSIADTGIGLAEEECEKIFERFSQADSSVTKRYGGTGLGLTVAKELVRRMGGRLWVESELGLGSTFYFTARFDVESGPELDPERVSFDGVKALVVARSPTERRILGEQLGLRGFAITDVDRTSAALCQARSAAQARQPFGLAIVDGRLLEDGGLTLARLLREEDTVSRVIVMLTADHRPGDLSACRALDGCEWIVKPIKTEELHQILTDIGSAPGRTSRGSEEQESRTGDLPPLRILLCDDSTDNRSLILAYLKSLPYRVVAVEDGRQAIERFKQEDFDLVLMDMQMPVLDGYKATKAIRGWERARAPGRRPTPVLALTAYAFREEVQRSLEAGCDGHLTKPIRRKVLLEAIATYAQLPPQRVKIDEDIVDLVPAYLENRQGDVQRLRRAIADHDHETVRHVGHNMKGSGAGYGFEKISQLGAELEQAGRVGDATLAARCVNQLETFLDCVEIDEPEGRRRHGEGMTE